MGGAARKMARSIKNYNIQSKTDKYLDKIAKDKPEMAPRHPTARKILHDSAYVNTDLEFKEKSETLSSKLQNVKVDSFGPPPPILKSRKSGPLPESRAARQFSYPTSASVTEGKANFTTILEFIKLHQDNPQAYTAQDIAREYKLKLANVEQVLDHYKVLKLHMSSKLKAQYKESEVPRSIQVQVNEVLLKTGEVPEQHNLSGLGDDPNKKKKEEKS